MPPKRRPKNTNSQENGEVEQAVSDENLAMATSTGSSNSLEALLDRRLNQQSEQINELFVKFTQMTKIDLEEVKKSQEFLSAKFDGLIKSVSDLQAENIELRTQNDELRSRADKLEYQATTNMNDLEYQRQYSRRDLLEIQGVPVVQGEDTNAIVVKIVELIDPNMSFNANDISTSHRLPTTGNMIPPIIVKFTRRDVRDKIYQSKRRLYLKKASDMGMGYSQDAKLYINESLTRKMRILFKEVRAFKRSHDYKFAWTKNGTVFLKKTANPSCEVNTFTSIDEFKGWTNSLNIEG